MREVQARRAAVWLHPAQAPLIRAAADAAGVEVIGAGSPGRQGAGEAARALEAEAINDLRSLLAEGLVGSEPVGLVLIAAPGDFGRDPGGTDTGVLLSARSRGLRVATLEPVPASAMDFSSGRWSTSQHGVTPAEAIRLVPLLRRAAPFRQAQDVLDSFGEIRTMAFESWSRTEQSSLGAALINAMDVVLTLMGEPEVIDAAYASHHAHRLGVNPSSDTLRDLSGDLTANLRYADGRAASVIASDQGGRWNRTVTVVGPSGRLRIFDDGFEWIAPDGTIQDRSRRPGVSREEGQTVDHAVEALAEALTRLTDPAAPAEGPDDLEGLLALAQATLLSARTGEGESPGTIRKMLAPG